MDRLETRCVVDKSVVVVGEQRASTEGIVLIVRELIEMSEQVDYLWHVTGSIGRRPQSARNVEVEVIGMIVNASRFSPECKDFVFTNSLQVSKENRPNTRRCRQRSAITFG